MRKKIEKSLEHGPRTNKQLRDDLGLTKTKPDPKLDRTLQKMRREGVVSAAKGRWFGLTVQVCPTCSGKGWVDTSKL